MVNANKARIANKQTLFRFATKDRFKICFNFMREKTEAHFTVNIPANEKGDPFNTANDMDSTHSIIQFTMLALVAQGYSPV